MNALQEAFERTLRLSIARASRETVSCRAELVDARNAWHCDLIVRSPILSEAASSEALWEIVLCAPVHIVDRVE